MKQRARLPAFEDAFLNATENPIERPEYIKDITHLHGMEKISKTIYQTAPREEAAMTCKHSLLSSMGFKGYKARIVVRPQAFEPEVHQNHYDFENSLVYNMGWHARGIFTGETLRHFPLVDALGFALYEAEVLRKGYKNAFEHTSDLNSLTYMHRVLESIKFYEEKIKELRG